MMADIGGMPSSDTYLVALSCAAVEPPTKMPKHDTLAPKKSSETFPLIITTPSLPYGWICEKHVSQLTRPLLTITRTVIFLYCAFVVHIPVYELSPGLGIPDYTKTTAGLLFPLATRIRVFHDWSYAYITPANSTANIKTDPQRANRFMTSK